MCVLNRRTTEPLLMCTESFSFRSDGREQTIEIGVLYSDRAQGDGVRYWADAILIIWQ